MKQYVDVASLRDKATQGFSCFVGIYNGVRTVRDTLVLIILGSRPTCQCNPVDVHTIHYAVWMKGKLRVLRSFAISVPYIDVILVSLHGAGVVSDQTLLQ